MSEWVMMAWTFVLVAAGGAIVFTLVRRLLAPVGMQQWQLAAEGTLDDEVRDRPMLQPVSKALAGSLPMSKTEESELGKELKNAGFYRPSAFVEYAAIRAILVLIPLIATGIAAYLAPSRYLFAVLVGGAASVVLGFSLPRIYLLLRTRWRRREIERSLPLTIDLLTLCLSAGQTIVGALQQVSRELHYSHPVIAGELAIAHQQASIHTLSVALTQWADRTPVPEVRNLALILEQSERLGTDVAGTLQEFAAHFRTTLRQRAETRGNRVSFWMLIPSVFCLWTASAVILIGPAYNEYVSHTQQTPVLFNKARKDIDRVNQRPNGSGVQANSNTGEISQ